MPHEVFITDEGTMRPVVTPRLAVFLSKNRGKRLRFDFVAKTRSLDQNSRFWALIKVFEELGWEKDEAKQWVCREFLPPIVRELPDGTRVEIVSGTSKLTVAQMSELQDRIERFLVQNHIQIPTHEEAA